MNPTEKTVLLSLKTIIANQRLLLKKAYGLSEDPDADTTAAELAVNNAAKLCDVINGVIDIGERKA